MVVSGTYDCQLVFVMKLMAVLKARSGVIAVAFAGAPAVLKCWGLNGSQPCRRWNAYTMMKLNTLREIKLAVYRVDPCSTSSRMPAAQYTRRSTGRRIGWRKVRSP